MRLKRPHVVLPACDFTASDKEVVDFSPLFFLEEPLPAFCGPRISPIARFLSSATTLKSVPSSNLMMTASLAFDGILATQWAICSEHGTKSSVLGLFSAAAVIKSGSMRKKSPSFSSA